MADYTIDGLTPEDAARVRSLIADMAPTALPSRIAFLPAKNYAKFAQQVQRGQMGNRRVGAGEGSDEKYGANHTTIGGAFSAVGSGQTWANADLLKRPKDLAATLAHELGHYHAASTGGNASEAVADAQRAVYLKRAAQAQKIDRGVQALPPNAQGVLSGALRALQAEPRGPLTTIAGK